MSTRNSVRTRKNKERSKNFTELEKRTVLELINQHREVLRQGRSNNATNKSKQMVWSQICIEVNKRCKAECPRTPAQVKMWYENFKKKCKMRYQEPGSEESGTNLLDGMLWTVHPGQDVTVKDERRDLPPSVILNTSDEHLPVNMSSDRLDDSSMISEGNDSKDELLNATPISLLQPQVSMHHSPMSMSPTLRSQTPTMALDRGLRHRLDTEPSTSRCESPQDSNGPLNLSHLEPSVCIVTPPLPLQPQSNGMFNTVVNLATSCHHNNNNNSKSFFNHNNNFNFNNNKKCSSMGGVSGSHNSGGRIGHDCNVAGAVDRANASVPLPQGNHVHNDSLGSYFCSSASPTEEEKLFYTAKRQHAIWEHEAKMKILQMELKQKDEIFSLQKQLFLIELKLRMDLLEKNSSK